MAMSSKEWAKLHPIRWKRMQRKYYLKYRRVSCKKCGEPIPYPADGRRYHPECAIAAKKLLDERRIAELTKRVSLHKCEIGCSKCGYNKCGAALDWHHTQNNKERRLTIRNYFTRLGDLERKKCILLCANCHREIHSNGEN